VSKVFVLFSLLYVSTFARFSAFPLKECKAYNNMKHSRNTHNLILDTSRKYTILKKHKGQYLLLVKNEQPSQRWVDDTCFVNKKAINKKKSSEEKAYNKKHTKKYENKLLSNKNILALSWHNAFCETNRYKKECKKGLLSFLKNRYSQSHFVLHGLWPQPKNKLYCKVDKDIVSADKHKQWRDLPCLIMDTDTEDRLAKVMPGYASDLHKHEWVKHGTCYGTGANKYFSDAIMLTEQFNNSKLGDFFKKNIGKKVTLKQIRHLFDRSFGVGTGKRVELKCKRGLITELWLHLGSGEGGLSTLLKKGKNIQSRCHQGLIDRAGYDR